MPHVVHTLHEPKEFNLLQPGERVACRYRIERCHRQHPLGELYRCHDETGERPVLLQRLRQEFADPDVRDRLFETRGSAALEIPAIADILDYGEDLDGRPFLVTAWRDEASLAEVERPLSFAEAVAIVERVAVALDPVHRAHLVHGGIEPSNVLVDDARELAGLLDFGLVPALEAGAAGRIRALPLLVAPAYAAPELIRGQPLHPSADVYALGVLLWELIFGAAPFRGPTLRVLDAHLNRPLPARELPFDAPASFDWILRRMLAKDPRDRFADAAEVAAQLRVYACLSPAAVVEALLDEPRELTGEVEAEDEDDATVVFERRMEQPLEQPLEQQDNVVVLPSSSLAAAGVPAFETGRARRVPRRFAALAGLACAALVGLGWLGALHDDAGTPRSLAPHTTQAMAHAEDPGLMAGSAAQARPAPSPRVLAAPEPTLPAKLSLAHLQARKSELYRRVERRCVNGHMRRTIKLAIRVAPSGAVEAASVVGGMASTRIGRCVRQQGQQLEFPASEAGGYYTYTLRLR